jgi:catechol-2,3-dioxygenase
MPDFPPIGHVAVTVTDLSVSRPWYRRLTGTDPVLDEPTDGGFHHTVFVLGSTLLGLHQHPQTDTDAAFTELRPGLDHIAFTCPDRTTLTAWQVHLDDLAIPHGGIIDAHYGTGLSFKDPDGIALEFFAPPN